MMVEFTGLPGAGKSTICRSVAIPHGGKGSVSLWSLKPSKALFRTACSLMALAASARPLSLGRLKRAFNLVVLLRHYQRQPNLILLDQGLIQKTWSLLADAATFSESRLKDVLRSFAAYAPDIIVWVETPLAAAVERMAVRRHGNSRYDTLPPHEARALLAERAPLLRQIATALAATPGVRFVELDGAADPVVNAAAVDALLRPPVI